MNGQKSCLSLLRLFSVCVVFSFFVFKVMSVSFRSENYNTIPHRHLYLLLTHHPPLFSIDFSCNVCVQRLKWPHLKITWEFSDTEQQLGSFRELAPLETSFHRFIIVTVRFKWLCFCKGTILYDKKKWVTSSKNESSVTIYSPSCLSKCVFSVAHITYTLYSELIR